MFYLELRAVSHSIIRSLFLPEENGFFWVPGCFVHAISETVCGTMSSQERQVNAHDKRLQLNTILILLNINTA